MSAEPTERQRRITELATLLIEEADAKQERREIEAKQREVLDEHDVAATDQTKAELQTRATLLASYFTQLVRDGVPPDEAIWLVRDEADWFRECA